MNQKTAGLYVSLAKALNALEEAGEDPWPNIDGHAASVQYDAIAEKWVVVDEA